MKTIHHVLDIDAGSDSVWSALTEPDRLTFRFELTALDDGRTHLRFWQDYAVELADDYYGVYNFNWGYYLESLRLLCVTGTGKPFAAEKY